MKRMSISRDWAGVMRNAGDIWGANEHVRRWKVDLTFVGRKPGWGESWL